MTDLVFEDPPPKRPGGYPPGQSPVGKWLYELRGHPNRWAKFPGPVAASHGTQIRGGRKYGVTAGEFETYTCTIVGTTRVHLYARYIGGDK